MKKYFYLTYIIFLILFINGCYTQLAITENEFIEYNYNDSTRYHQNNNSFYGNSIYYYDTKPWWLIEFNYFNSNVGNSYSSSSYSAPAVSSSNTSINEPQPVANSNRTDNSSSKSKTESTNNTNSNQNTNKRSERNSDGSRGK